MDNTAIPEHLKSTKSQVAKQKEAKKKNSTEQATKVTAKKSKIETIANEIKSGEERVIK